MPYSFDIATVDFAKGDGLVPAIVQHNTSGRVLMLGYMNREALQKTFDTGQVTFFSRKKQCLWTKGETSGNTLRVCCVHLDCDRDTLLVTASPDGPTCHLGTQSCFDTPEIPLPYEGNVLQCSDQALSFLQELEGYIHARKEADPEESYVAKMHRKGIKKIGQKVGEEGVEVALEAESGSDEDLLAESADLLFHLILLLRIRGLGLRDVVRVMHERHRKKDSK